MDKRFVQAHKEARWALWLTLLYLAAWLAAAYLPDSISVLPACHTGLKWPACWYRCCLFCCAGRWSNFIFRDIPLEDDDAA
jgi:uncharacterized membrane protein YhdT